MRKRVKKLILRKESLLLLSQSDARRVAGGSDVNTCPCPFPTLSCTCGDNCSFGCTYGGCGETSFC